MAAASTGSTGSSSPVAVDVDRVTPQRGSTVKIDGVEYKVTVWRTGAHGARNDVTQQYADWTRVAQEVVGIANTVVGGNAVDKKRISIVLTGAPEDLTTMPQRAAEVRLRSMHVTSASAASGAADQVRDFTADTIPQDKQAAVLAHVVNIGKTALRKASTTPPIPTVQVAGGGRCLDMSIAYQILVKTNPDPSNLTPTDPRIQPRLEPLANYLRTEVARLLRNDDMYKEDAFITDCLLVTLENVLTAQRDAAATAEDDPVESLIVRFGIRPIMVQVAAAIEQGNPIDAHAKHALTEFYASYITLQTPVDTGSMNQYLDHAFLYVLPSVNIPPNLLGDSAQAGGAVRYTYAVVQDGGEPLVAKYPLRGAWTPEQTVFVSYDGYGHYRAVDTSQLAAFQAILEIIQSSRVNSLDTFYTKLSCEVVTQQTQSESLSLLKEEYQEAYEALAERIYWHDIEAWNATPAEHRQSAEPGTAEQTTHNGVTYPTHQYGEWRLHSIPPAELTALLQSQSMNKTAVTAVVNRRRLAQARQ